MVADISLGYVKRLMIIYSLIIFIQIAEMFFKIGYVGDVNFVGGVLSFLEGIPILGFFVNLITINIPGVPDVILLILNLINMFLIYYSLAILNNIIVEYFDLDEGILGALF